MKSGNERFEGFLRRARRGRPETATPAPHGMAGGILARWRSAGTSPDFSLLILRLTRWGLCGAVALSTLLFFTVDRTPPPSLLMDLAGVVEDAATLE